MSLIADAAFAGIRASLEVTLTHRCTYQAMVAGTEDGHGDAPAAAFGVAVTDVPCRYEEIQRAVRDEEGITLVSIPTLTVSATGPVVLGGVVTHVTDQLGGMRAAGPLSVERVVDDTAGLGAPLLPVYELRSVDAVRP